MSMPEDRDAKSRERGNQKDKLLKNSRDKETKNSKVEKYPISVIVPVYNTASYLGRCIDSLLKQTMPVFILLIDDGSTDQSSEICDQYAREHDNISVIHKENGGPGSCRNLGIRNMETEWIGFVDSDDWVTEDMYAYLYQLQKQYQADVVQIEYMIAPEGQKKPTVSGREEVICLTNRGEILHRYLTDGMKPAKSYSSCTKIYRKPLFDNIRFPEGEVYEDVITNYEILSKAEKYVISGKQCYYYFIRSQSITKGRFQRADLDYIKAGEQIAERTAGNPALKELGQMTLARFHFMCLCKMLKYGCDDDIDWKQQIRTSIPIIRSGRRALLKSGMKTDRKAVMLLLSANTGLTNALMKATQSTKTKGTEKQ